jgi:hypothetical protein
MRWVRLNDCLVDTAGPPGLPDLNPALGTGFNCNRDWLVRRQGSSPGSPTCSRSLGSRASGVPGPL